MFFVQFTHFSIVFNLSELESFVWLCMRAIEGLFLCLWCVCSAESRSIGKFCGVVTVVCACFLACLVTLPSFSIIQSLNHSFCVYMRAIEGVVCSVCSA